jgi:hypothetical protein
MRSRYRKLKRFFHTQKISTMRISVLNTCGAILLLLTMYSVSFAQEAAPGGAVPAGETATDEEKKVSISGFIDGYYMHGFNKTGLGTSFTRVHNSFNLGMANVMFSKEGKVGFMADLAVGPRAEEANGYAGSVLSAIKQLYITYSPTDALKFTFGNFSTFVGYEVIDAPVNANYSMSYLFSNGPFYHTGLKADLELGANFGVMIGLFDDTDRKFDEVPGKHIGGQFRATLGGLSAYANVLHGREIVGDEGDDDTFGFQADLTATYAFSEKFKLGLNVSDKTSKTGDITSGGFFGSALYAGIVFSESFDLGLRGEYFLPKGLGDQDAITAFTLSGNIRLGSLTLVPEFRIDTSSGNIFEDAGNSTFTNRNSALLLAAIYAF